MLLCTTKSHKILVNVSYRHSVEFRCSPTDLRDRRLSERRLSFLFDIFQILRHKSKIVSVSLAL